MIEHQNEHRSNHRTPVLSEDACEVAHFARKFHLTMPEARMLMRAWRQSRPTGEGSPKIDRP